MDLATRIQRILNEQNLKQTEFANALKVTESYISNMVRGKRDSISESLATLIHEKFGYSTHWILTGEGDAYTKKDITLNPLKRKAIMQIENMSKCELSATLAFIHSLGNIKSHLKEEN